MGTPLPTRYESVMLRIAVVLFSQRGAEGQVSHTENGITRMWESTGATESLLKSIMPMVGSVVSNEDA